MEHYFKIHQKGVLWQPNADTAHRNKISLCGQGNDFLVTFGVDKDCMLFLSHYQMFPTLRTIPNATHSSWRVDCTPDNRAKLSVDGNAVSERVESFFFDGVLKIVTSDREEKVEITRFIYPASKALCGIERVNVKNISKEDVRISLDKPSGSVFSKGRGTKGIYLAEIMHDLLDETVLQPNETKEFSIQYTARIANGKQFFCDAESELQKRRERISELCDRVVLDTGDEVLDTFFRLCKLHVGESVFDTLGGVIHSPGGTAYYAASWANDQLEYASPWAAFHGDEIFLKSIINSFRHYIPFMWEDYDRIPCSVICEGLDIWEAAGDRGDAEMFLYGGSQLIMTRNDPELTNELYPALKWCAEYIERQKTPEGVIGSDSDELEGRFPTDSKANLYTSSLAYGGLVNLSYIARDMGECAFADILQTRAKDLRESIEKYFGANIHGFDTYIYSKGFTTLRAWSIAPALMGITERADGSLAGVFSEHLLHGSRLLSCELGEENDREQNWDRSFLYALLCLFKYGKSKDFEHIFRTYCLDRLTGETSPYPIEVWPGECDDIRHLSAESGLFCRIITEGMLGFKNTGLGKFSLTPQVPDYLDRIYLTDIHLLGAVFDIKADRQKTEIYIDGKLSGSVAAGETYFYG